MKPHEEQWVHRGQEEVVRTGDGYIRAAVYGAGSGGAPRHEVARFIATAPDMARALLAHGRLARSGLATEWHSEKCADNGREECEPECDLARDALRKAGVL